MTQISDPYAGELVDAADCLVA